MDNLPDTTLLQIFAYLNIYEKLHCLRVSKKWKEILNDWKLWQRIDFRKESGLTSLFRDEILEEWTLVRGEQYRELYLDCCTLLTDKGVSTVGHICRNLQVLSLRYCEKVGDPGIIQLSKICHRLRHVDFHGTRVTSMG